MGRPAVLDVFAGVGGLGLGFEQAGFDVAAAVEIDPIHAATHAFNFPRCATLCADATGVSGADIRRAVSEPIDVIVGGAPCQGFSMIGKRALDDPRNQLVSISSGWLPNLSRASSCSRTSAASPSASTASCLRNWQMNSARPGTP